MYLIVGDNSYRIEQEIAKLAAAAGVNPERLDASVLDRNALADVMRGVSLFSMKRLVVIRDLSEQKDLWDVCGEWASGLSDDTTLVLVESKPDRRTKAYKTLAKQATVIQAPLWTERDRGAAEEWLRHYAQKHHVGLSPKQVSDMALRATASSERGSTIDQFQLVHAIAALAHVDQVTDEAIATVLPDATTNVLFDLIGYAANRQQDRVYQGLADLRLNEDPYGVFPMFAAEWSRLVAVAVVDQSSPAATIATELGIHPFVVQKLLKLTKLFTREQLHDLTMLAADIDAGMKLSQFAPWDGIDRFVIGILLRK